MLVVTSQRNGNVLDSVDLHDGRLTYSSGVAREYVEGARRIKPGLTDAELYALAADTSNGYITISTVGGDA
jgi:hypothetical protein